MQRFNSFICLFACITGFCPHINMLPVRLIPYRTYIQSGLIGFHDGSQLSLSLVCKTITHTNTVFT
ncbi:hypothetical protein SDC9_178012 [bioreactor metagenome]|uniref:Uncharacterized protein n=1 Tax=bioreactor metagenome TaxID=1076179 RepID=A0A645GUJ8_9ZZZZ